MDETIKTVMTERVEAPTDETILKTPQGYPDVEVVSMSVWAQALVRAARTFLQGLVPTLVAAPTGAPQAAMQAAAKSMAIPLPENQLLFVLLSVVCVPLGPALVSLIQNVWELTARYDTTKPELRA